MPYNKGDIVKVSIPSDAEIPIKMWDFNNKELKILRTSKNRAKRNGYCELEGAISARGGHYVFMNEWLEKA